MIKVQAKKNEINQMVSIVIPVYNERQTIQILVARVQKVEIRKELIIVDDGSTDGTAQWLDERFKKDSANEGLDQKLADELFFGPSPVRLLTHPCNQGKGAALKTGFRQARGNIIIVQDADLEYNPEDYPRLLEPLLHDRADVVYGSRVLGASKRIWPLTSYLGNKLFTALTNAASGLSLTDVWTGYKVFRTSVLEDIALETSGFDMELELTVKVAQRKWRVVEVPISYIPRSRVEGKKIDWRDGIQSMKTLWRYRHSL